MKFIKITLLTLMLITNAIFTTGCWNYREVDKFFIVGGIAVDKGLNEKYKVTTEILKITGGKDTKTSSKTISVEGSTMFDTARNTISLSGKRLYWSHAKVIIISKEIASEGVSKIIDWYNRDSETREDVYLLISGESTAKEIFDGHAPTEDIKSFELGDIMRNQVSLSKAPITDILQFDIESQTKGMSVIIPVVKIMRMDGANAPQIIGTAIIKNDKLVGFLDGDETKYLNFIRNEVKGGVLTEQIPTNDVPIFISLEIFRNNTKIKPIVDEKKIEMELNIDTEVAIDEIGGVGNFFDEEGQRLLEQGAESKLNDRIEALIKKVQSEYDADIFGFGAKLHEDKVKTWNSVSNNWDEVFKELKVNVKTKVHIKNSAVVSKTFEEGE